MVCHTRTIHPGPLNASDGLVFQLSHTLRKPVLALSQAQHIPPCFVFMTGRPLLLVKRDCDAQKGSRAPVHAGTAERKVPEGRNFRVQSVEVVCVESSKSSNWTAQRTQALHMMAHDSLHKDRAPRCIEPYRGWQGNINCCVLSERRCVSCCVLWYYTYIKEYSVIVISS
jgi:hypothetical protein